MTKTMRIAPAAVLFLMACLLAAGCVAEDRFQSVSGDFARSWLKGNLNQSPAAAPKPAYNESGDLWNWGAAPKGSSIVDGKLLTDPYYLHPWLNISSNWLGETYTDPATGLPLNIYLDPMTGKTIYAYLNPNTGKPYYTYSSSIDPNNGKQTNYYIDPLTGNPVSTPVSPAGIANLLTNTSALPQVFASDNPWI